ncbi:MAG: hypothetical protein IPF98_22565 [Gemmatimonadetes bacterium]|nr:hypothetical protein [Gemmatimonadota bacterium]
MSDWDETSAEQLARAFDVIVRAKGGGVSDREQNSAFEVVRAQAIALARDVGREYRLSLDELDDVVQEQLVHFFEKQLELRPDSPRSYLRACLAYRIEDHRRRAVAHPTQRHDEAPDAQVDPLTDAGVRLAIRMGWPTGPSELTDLQAGRALLATRMRMECGDPDASGYLAFHECVALGALPVDGTDESIVSVGERRSVRFYAGLRRATITHLVQRALPWMDMGASDANGLQDRVKADLTRFVTRFLSKVTLLDGLSDITSSVQSYLTATLDEAESPHTPTPPRLAAAAARVHEVLMRRLHVDDLLDFRAFEERLMQQGFDITGDPLPRTASEKKEAEAAEEAARAARAGLTEKSRREKKRVMPAWSPAIAVPRQLAMSIQLLRNAEGPELRRLERIMMSIGRKDDESRRTIQDRYAQRQKRALARVDWIAQATREDDSLAAGVRRGVLLAAASLYASTKGGRKYKSNREGAAPDALGGTDAAL